MQGFGDIALNVTEAAPSTGKRLRSVYRPAALLAVLACLLLSSCTLATVSRHVVRETNIPLLDERTGLICAPSGEVPYQKWLVPPWHQDLRYVWVVGDYDFSRCDGVELILYFHGMHAKDYYQAFRNELTLLKEQRPDRPFLFIGFVDTPYLVLESRHTNRWRSLSPSGGEAPELLFKTVNRIFAAFRKRFPHIRKEETNITLAGFSGGGRVLDSVGAWLARTSDEDPFARVFRSRLGKMAYFDCWFDTEVLETVPALLKGNPSMTIVGTVHMDKPRKNAELLADKLKMKKLRNEDAMVGLGGRVKILKDKSHWSAMISRLREAL